MKKIPNWIVVMVVIGVLIASKFIFFPKKEGNGKGPKGLQAAPVLVNYHVIQAHSFSNDIYTTGTIGAFNQVDILPEVNGKVTGVYFKEGELVNKGDLLIKLNGADLEAQLQKTRTQLKLSEQKLERLKKLLGINGISQEEFDMQDNELAGLKADEAYIKAQLDKTTIVAPFSGRIGLKNISEGAYISASTPVVSLVQLTPLFIEFAVPEKYSTFFNKGAGVQFSQSDPQASGSYSATVYAVEPKVEESTKTIRARALYSGKETLYPGSFVKVFVKMEETKNALMIPTQSIIGTLKGQKVFVCRNGAAEEVQVEIGVRTDESIQVLSGLHAGDTVVTSGLLSVKKGTKLTLLKTVN